MEARTCGGVEFAMVDPCGEMGPMLELYEPGEELAGFHVDVKRKSQGWDGQRPVRRLAQ